MPRGRIPHPWCRRSTGMWFTTLDGRQIPLGRDKRSAHAEFVRLMASRGQGVVAEGRITVRALADLWLEDCTRRLARATVDHYRSEIGSFVSLCGSVQARDLKPYHLTSWVAAHPDWAQSSQHSAITAVKVCVGWGKRQGYLDVNPIVDAARPGIERRRPITMEQAERVMAASTGMLLTALRLLLVTGLRPGELCSLDASRIDLVGRRAIVTGKSGKRTVPLGEAAASILEPLKCERGTGPLLHGQRGKLTVDALDAACKRARLRAAPDGSLDHVTPQCFRGLFSTEALRRGVDAAIVSLLLGHRDATILLRHYASPDHAMLRAAMEQATRRSDTTSDKPRDPVR